MNGDDYGVSHSDIISVRKDLEEKTLFLENRLKKTIMRLEYLEKMSQGAQAAQRIQGQREGSIKAVDAGMRYHRDLEKWNEPVSMAPVHMFRTVNGKPEDSVYLVCPHCQKPIDMYYIYKEPWQKEAEEEEL